MTNPHYPDIGEDNGVDSDLTPVTGTPAWVKIFAGVGLIVILLFVVLQFVGSGSHGPDRHLPTGTASDHIPPADVLDYGTHHP